jgi:hypothetical protein
MCTTAAPPFSPSVRSVDGAIVVTVDKHGVDPTVVVGIGDRDPDDQSMAHSGEWSGRAARSASRD